jgi:chemotaxis protein MotB
MKPTPTIIIKPRKRVHEAHHGGAWKVAYADFVTALMAFFLVMWLVGQNTAVRHAIAAYFKDPGAFAEGRGASILEGGGGIAPGDGAKPVAKPTPVPQDRQTLEQAATEIKQALEATPEFGEVRGQVEIHMTSEGLRIEMQESASSCFFDTGSATMTPQAERLFGTIGRQLQKLPNGVLVEGHTDSRQYSSREGYTNWELSADRANAVRRVMEKAGLGLQRVREVRGYADTQLRVAANPMDARNRRVSILVRNADGSVVAAPEAIAKAKVGPQ